MISTRIAFPLAGLVLGVALGLGLNWKLYHPKPAPIQTAAPEVRQKDGSLVLKREPAAAPILKATVLPKGAKIERQVEVKVAPLPTIPTAGAAIPGPGPLTVDLSVIRLKDNTQRVIASSSDGQIISGVDVPIGPAAPVVKIPKWEAGALYNPGDRTYGAYIHRSFGPFVLGATVVQDRLPVLAGGGTGTNAYVSLGVRW